MTTPTTVEKKLLRIADVLEIRSMSRSTLWRPVKTGQFRAPLKVGGPNGRAVRWLRNGHRGVDSRPATNLQRVNGVLSAVSGRQASRWDRPKRASRVRVDAEPDVPILKQGTRDVGRRGMVNRGAGADLHVPLARHHKPTGRLIGTRSNIGVDWQRDCRR